MMIFHSSVLPRASRKEVGISTYILSDKKYLSREEWEAALTRTGNTAVTKATSQFEGRRLFYPKVHLYRI
jgi:hypothetical protein